MTFRLTLHAPSDKGVRSFGEEWVANAVPSSLYEARSWLGAMRCCLASLLAHDEPYFLLVVRTDDGRPAHVLGVEREWPHTIFDGGGVAASVGLNPLKRIAKRTVRRSR